MSSLLLQIKESYPMVYEAFSALPDGERHLRGIMELDRYWEHLHQPVPEVVKPGSELPEGVEVNGDFDLIYAGGTLSLLHAAVMARQYDRKVLVFDRHTPAQSTRDWNISRGELLKLADTGVFSLSELESVILRAYKTGWVEFYKPDGSQKRLYIRNVLDCAVDADLLLSMARDVVLSMPENRVLSQTSFTACYRFADHIVVEVTDSEGKSYHYRGKVLVDMMGVRSPVAMQLNEGVPQTHVCPTVGTIASGFMDADFDTGEILASIAPADIASGTGKQFIWEGFPAKGSEYITYLFFYDEVDSQNDKSLLGLFETYFRTLPEYKKIGPDFSIHRPVYGIIPAYFHDGFSRTREIADDRIILFGDAASLGSPLTFCGFGSLVRNLHHLTADLDLALDSNALSKKDLEKISAYEPNVASMANLMKYMCFNAETDEPNFVNDLMNEVMVVLDELPERYRQAMFRDEMKIEELVVVMLRVAWRYPKVLKATWDKLGVAGSTGFLKNLVGWVFSSAR
ncbi:MAG: lycopene beta-monocyclase CruA [Chlorobium sp.]|jgi:lycopene cyclase CruA|nr:lycopene beta-monocyclase CruA [Chlorobium sp.]